MKNIISIHDLPSDIHGKTWKEKNLERIHVIPLWSLVEISNGVRLFVCKHARDCDGTPLYSLTLYGKEKYEQIEDHYYMRASVNGYDELSIKLIS